MISIYVAYPHITKSISSAFTKIKFKDFSAWTSPHYIVVFLSYNFYFLHIKKILFIHKQKTLLKNKIYVFIIWYEIIYKKMHTLRERERAFNNSVSSIFFIFNFHAWMTFRTQRPINKNKKFSLSFSNWISWTVIFSTAKKRRHELNGNKIHIYVYI
jgi:hypothetical protein